MKKSDLMEDVEQVTDGPLEPEDDMLEAEPDPLEFAEAEAEAEAEEEEAAEEEVVKVVEEHFDDAIKLYLREIQRTRLLTADEEKELAGRIAKGEKAARDKMIESNLRLVVKI